MHVFSSSQDRLQMRRARRVQMGYVQMGEDSQSAVAGGVTSAEIDAAAEPTALFRPIFIGVATGVSVWLATRLLDRIFGIERRNK